jgi:hypothetical protein
VLFPQLSPTNNYSTYDSSLKVECTRINKAAGVFVENYNCKAVKLAHSQGVEILSPGGIFASETMMGMNVNPSEWDPELFIPCQVCF